MTTSASSAYSTSSTSLVASSSVAISHTIDATSSFLTPALHSPSLAALLFSSSFIVTIVEEKEISSFVGMRALLATWRRAASSMALSMTRARSLPRRILQKFFKKEFFSAIVIKEK